jgi:hypothetical protein
MYEQHRDDIGPEPPLPPQPPEPPPPPEEPDPDRFRRGMILGLGGAVLLAVIAFLAGVVFDNGGDEDVRASSTATTASPTTTEATLLPGVTPSFQTVPPTTVAPGVVNAVTGTPQLAAATTTTAKPSPTTTVAPCRNSHDATCGPFRWEPPPGPNEPLTASAPCGAPQVCVDEDTVQGTAGQSLNFHLVASDPDAKIDKTCIVIDWGDGTGATTGECPPPPNCPTPYGPWAPPARVADSDDRPVFHTYESPGDYTAMFRYQSLPSCDPNPYGGTANAAGHAHVIAAP